MWCTNYTMQVIKSYYTGIYFLYFVAYTAKLMAVIMINLTLALALVLKSSPCADYPACQNLWIAQFFSQELINTVKTVNIIVH